MASQAMQRPLLKSGARECDLDGEGHLQTRAQLVMALQMAMTQKTMTQVQAARLLGTDQPTLSKVLRGRTASVSLEKLVSWLVTLGRSVEIRVYEPSDPALASLTAKVSGLSDA